MEKIVSVNLSQIKEERELEHKSLKLTGKIDLHMLLFMKRHEYDYLDVSEAGFVIDKEEWAVCLGWAHSGPVYGNSGYRDVEVLRRFLEEIKATTILLPDNVMRRHINSAKTNECIKELRVSDKCKLFAYQNGKLMNKKKTAVVFG